MQTVRLSWVKSKTFIRNENGGLTTGFNLSLVVLVTVLVAVAIAVPLVVLWNEPKWTQVENSTEIVTSAIFVTDEVITKREPLSFGPTLETTVNTAVTITIEDLTEPSTDLPIEPQTDEPQTSVPSNLPTNPPTVPPTTTTTESPTACDFSPCNNNGVCSDNNSPTNYFNYQTLCTNFFCVCPFPYQGITCDSEIPCHSVTCLNGGRCSYLRTGTHTCDCQNTGYHGNFCERFNSIYECSFRPQSLSSKCLASCWVPSSEEWGWCWVNTKESGNYEYVGCGSTDDCGWVSNRQHNLFLANVNHYYCSDDTCRLEQ